MFQAVPGAKKVIQAEFNFPYRITVRINLRSRIMLHTRR
jgi:hypothetical protein